MLRGQLPGVVLTVAPKARRTIHIEVGHLCAHYHEALCRIGAKVFLLARQGQLA